MYVHMCVYEYKYIINSTYIPRNSSESTRMYVCECTAVYVCMCILCTSCMYIYVRGSNYTCFLKYIHMLCMMFSEFPVHLSTDPTAPTDTPLVAYTMGTTKPTNSGSTTQYSEF